MPPIEDFSEEVAELAKGEEEDVAEEGGQCGEIRDRDHFGAEIGADQMAEGRNRRRRGIEIGFSPKSNPLSVH